MERRARKTRRILRGRTLRSGVAVGKKPVALVYKFSSCDGCQVNFLEIPEIFKFFDVCLFYEAQSRNELPERVDVAFVEGSVSTPEELSTLRKLREIARFLVPIGACATSGGIQSLRNDLDGDYVSEVYRNPDNLEILPESRPLRDFVKVDIEIPGCPVNIDMLSAFVRDFLWNKRLYVPSHPVCLECKKKGNVCVIVAKNTVCLGPITRAGCGALCPSFGRGCYGCFGPAENPNIKSFKSYLRENMKVPDDDIENLLRNMNFLSFKRKEGDKVEGEKGR